MKLPLFFVALLLLLVMPTLVQARLGESFEQCKARYGEIVSQKPEERTAMFKKGGLYILACFNPDLICEKLIMGREDRSDLSETERTVLVEANLGTGSELISEGRLLVWSQDSIGTATYNLEDHYFLFLTTAALARSTKEREDSERAGLKGF